MASKLTLPVVISSPVGAEEESVGAMSEGGLGVGNTSGPTSSIGDSASSSGEKVRIGWDEMDGTLVPAEATSTIQLSSSAGA